MACGPCENRFLSGPLRSVSVGELASAPAESVWSVPPIRPADSAAPTRYARGVTTVLRNTPGPRSTWQIDLPGKSAGSGTLLFGLLLLYLIVEG